MVRLTPALAVLVAALPILGIFGCVDDYDVLPLEAPGVLEDTLSYWVGDVQVVQRSTSTRSYDSVTFQFRGSVKNLGTTAVTGARFEIRTEDEVGRTLDGTPIFGDMQVGATQTMGILASQQELPINASYTYPSFSNRRITGAFTHD